LKFVCLANNRVGFEALRWLAERGDRPVGVVVHPEGRAKFRSEILEAAGLSSGCILEGPALSTPEGVNWLRDLSPDLLLSIYFGFILKDDVLSIPRLGAVNLHPGLLPFNKGAYPNVWSIVDHTPAGVTLHLIDSGVDTGNIIAQREVPIERTDTGATLYARLERVALDLFCETWPSIREGDICGCPQNGAGTWHCKADSERIDTVDPQAFYRAGDLIDLLRARTFPPHKGAYLNFGNERVYLRLELWSEKEQSENEMGRGARRAKEDG
jgi:methionyl-tRNA formyltransferase